MARFFSRFRSRDKPQNRTAGSSFTFYMGGSSSGKYVNERSAMQMTAVYACVRILSEAVAGLPLHLYRYNDSGGISLTLNIENFHNYRAEDINELADELSVILAAKMNRKAAAF